MNKKITLIFSCLLLIILFSHRAFAQQGNAITIIPPKFELIANPGDSLSETLRVRNESDSVVSYNVVVEDFQSSGEEGTVVLTEDETNTSFSLARWIEPETREITLQPNEEIPLIFNINVPKNAEPGGHYASVLLATETGEAAPGTASVTQRIGTLVLLRVSGNVTEKAIVESFTTPKYSKSGPITLELRLLNEGNTHIRPKGTIIITNLFGQKVDEIPLQGFNVLPNAKRKMDTIWDKKNLLGYYTATLVATYGEQNLPLTAATRFAVISPTAAILLGVGGVALLLLIISLISGRDRLKKALKVIATGN